MINLVTDNWKIKNIQAIIFDKDGTIIDLHFFWGEMTKLRCKNVIKFYNLNQDLISNLCLFLGFNIKTNKMLEDGITAIYSRPKIIELFIGELEKYNISPTKNEIEKIFDKTSEEFYENIEKYTKPIESAITFIKKLHNLNIKLGIVTSDSIIATNLMLKQLKLENYFQVIIGRESSIYTKESGEPTKIAIKKLGVNKENIVMIGDTITDFKSAELAGILKTILVATGQTKLKELEKISKYCINMLNDIKIHQNI